MQAMTSLACPVCATPYETGAETCAFCGVSLLEPEPKPAPKPKTRSRAKPAAPATAVPEIRADTPPSSPPVEAIEPPADEPPPSLIETVEPIADEMPPTPIETDDIAATPAVEPESPPETAEIAESSGIPEDFASPAPGTQAPSFATPRTAIDIAQRRLQRIEWGIAAGLALLLLVQVVASDFDQLAANAATRPWLQGICNALRCSLPPWHEPQALHLLQRDVQANPQRPGTLRISASFRNEARWTQPWPRLRVTLSDTDGRAIAARDFAANEYLGAKPTTNGIASGQVASVAFDVTDPSPRVTAFTFEFR